VAVSRLLAGWRLGRWEGSCAWDFTTKMEWMTWVDALAPPRLPTVLATPTAEPSCSFEDLAAKRWFSLCAWPWGLSARKKKGKLLFNGDSSSFLGPTQGA
jgi:hypothetical protein